jgi:hypothetical protein
MRNMLVEGHNLACNIIMKAISKTGSKGSCSASMDIGSSERHTSGVKKSTNFHGTAETRIASKRLVPPRFSGKNRMASSRPGAVLVAPISA